MVGKALGHYQVVEKISQIGMGAGYRAQDTNLHRVMAVKLLPGSLAANPERLTHFKREARLLASLNHPYFAAIHGLEQSEGKNVHARSDIFSFKSVFYEMETGH